MTTSRLEHDDPRKLARESLSLHAKVKRGGDAARRVVVRNLSSGGMMLEGITGLSVEDSVTADLPGIGKVEGVIAWTQEDRAGMAFAAPVDPTLAKRPRLRSV